MRTEPEQVKRERRAALAGWDELKHPRKSKGDPAGGEFVPESGSGGSENLTPASVSPIKLFRTRTDADEEAIKTRVAHPHHAVVVVKQSGKYVIHVDGFRYLRHDGTISGRTAADERRHG